MSALPYFEIYHLFEDKTFNGLIICRFCIRHPTSQITYLHYLLGKLESIVYQHCSSLRSDLLLEFYMTKPKQCLENIYSSVYVFIGCADKQLENKQRILEKS